MMYVERKVETGYTPYFENFLNRVPRIDEKGSGLAESTRRNMAMQEWQQREFGDVYPKQDVAETLLEMTPRIERRFGHPRR